MNGVRLWQIAGWTMLHYFWLGAVIGAVMLLLRRKLQSAGEDVRYAVALGGFCLLCVAPVAVAAWVAQHVPPAEIAVEEKIVVVATPLETPSEPSPAATPEASQRQSFATELPAFAPPPAVPSAAPLKPCEPPPAATHEKTLGTMFEPIAARLPWIWLFGAPLTFVLTAAGLLGAERLRRGSRLPEGPQIVETCRRLAAAIGVSRRVGVAICDRIAAPILLGIVRPMILLPAVALADWDAEQLEMVLLHELAHVRRYDNLVNLVQRILESVLFFHPMVWIISGWVRREREHCCDAIVVARTGRPCDYATMLITLAETQSVSLHRPAFWSPKYSQAASPFAERPLVARVRRILKKEKPAMRVSSRAFGAMVASVVILAVLVGRYSLPSYGKDAADFSAGRSASVPVAEAGQMQDASRSTATEAKPAIAVDVPAGKAPDEPPGTITSAGASARIAAQRPRPVAGKNFVVVPFISDLQRNMQRSYQTASFYVLVNGAPMINEDDTVLNVGAVDLKSLDDALQVFIKARLLKRVIVEGDVGTRNVSCRTGSASSVLLGLLQEVPPTTDRDARLSHSSRDAKGWASVVADLKTPPSDEDVRREQGVGDDLVRVYPICTPLARYLATTDTKYVVQNVKPFDRMTAAEIEAFPARVKAYVDKLGFTPSDKACVLEHGGASLSKTRRVSRQLHIEDSQWWAAKGVRFWGWHLWDDVQWTAPRLLIKVTAEDGRVLQNPQFKLEFAPEIKECNDTIKFTRQDDGRWESGNIPVDDEFRLTVDAQGYRPNSQNLTLPPGAVKELEIKLRPTTDTTESGQAADTLAGAANPSGMSMGDVGPGNVVDGIVVDEQGKPVEGATVRTCLATGASSTAVSGPDGGFRILLYEPRVFSVALTAMSADRSRQGFLTINDRRKSDSSPRLVLKPSRVIDVSVVDANNASVADATVETSAWYGTLGSSKTDANGKVRLSIPADVRGASVLAFKSGAGFDYLQTEQSMSRGDGLLPRSINLVLNGVEPGDVRVVDSAGRPVRGVTVDLWTLSKKDKGTLTLWGMRPSSVSDAEGHAKCDWLPADVQEAVFTIPSGDYSCPANPQFRIDWGGSPQHLTAQVLVNAEISGRVTYPDGKPAAGILIQAEGMGKPSYFRGYARSAQDGTYRLKVNPNMSYILAVVDSQWAAKSLTGIVLGEGEKRGNLDLRLDRGTLLHGTMAAGKNNEPYSDYTVTLVQLGAELPDNWKWRSTSRTHLARWTETDSNGRYAFRVGPGEYHLMLPGFNVTKPAVLTVAGEPEIVRDSQIARRSTATLHGLVVDKAGKPVPGAFVMSFGFVHESAVTDRNGRFTAERVTGDKATVYLRCPKANLVGAKTLTPDDTEVTIAVDKAPTATGRIVDQAGKPFAGVCVFCNLYRPHSPSDVYGRFLGIKAETNAEGHYAIPALPVDFQAQLSASRRNAATNKYETCKGPTFIVKPGENTLPDLVFKAKQPEPGTPRPSNASAEPKPSGDSGTAEVLAQWQAKRQAISTAVIKARCVSQGRSGVKQLSPQEVEALAMQYRAATDHALALKSLIRGLRNMSPQDDRYWGTLTLITDGKRIAERSSDCFVKDGRADVQWPLPGGQAGPTTVWAAGGCRVGTHRLDSFAVELQSRWNGLRLTRRDGGVSTLESASPRVGTIRIEVEDETGIIRRCTTLSKGQIVSETYQLGTIRCADGIVFPQVVFTASYSDDELYDLTLLSPSSVRVNEKLADDAFRVARPKGSSILDCRHDSRGHSVAIDEDTPDVVGYLLKNNSAKAAKAEKSTAAKQSAAALVTQ
jgi:beta-lactamase regulating signal transducer with metallopeptidase domain